MVGTGSRLITDVVAAAYQEMIVRHASGRLLDFGCGQVPLYGVYRDHVSDVVCVDWTESNHDLRHIDLAADLAAEIPQLEADSFDTILATDVLEHLPYPRVAWREFHRLLRPGGKVLLGVPFYYWLHEQPHDYHRYTEFALTRHATDAGLRPVTIDPYGGPVEILIDILAKASSPIPPLSAAISSLAALLRLGPVRRLSAAASRRMPLGYVGVFVKD